MQNYFKHGINILLNTKFPLDTEIRRQQVRNLPWENLCQRPRGCGEMLPDGASGNTGPQLGTPWIQCTSLLFTLQQSVTSILYTFYHITVLCTVCPATLCTLYLESCNILYSVLCNLQQYILCILLHSVLCTMPHSVLCTMPHSVLCTLQPSVLCTMEQSVLCILQPSILYHATKSTLHSEALCTLHPAALCTLYPATLCTLYPAVLFTLYHATFPHSTSWSTLQSTVIATPKSCSKAEAPSVMAG